MRGKGHRGEAPAVPFGITPAYAGKRARKFFEWWVLKDHPRLCGEKFQKNRRSPCYKGSPPPMRGKALSTSASCSAMRITPAYAGKSRVPPFRVLQRQDHPRLCGEKGLGDKIRPLRLGITPAYAGKSIKGSPATHGGGDHPRLCGEKCGSLGHPAKVREDHPRLCGEKSGCRCPLDSRQGSPPPMRGKVQQLPDRFRFLGITPAYAGKRFQK